MNAPPHALQPLRRVASGGLHRARVTRDIARARRVLAVQPGEPLIDVGDLGYGGQTLPDRDLAPDSVCYLIGVGEDISFDLALVARYGVTVHCFDPVPRASRFVARAAAHEPRVVFHPWAVWSRDEELTFHEPFRPGYVSQSAVNLHGTAASFTAPGRSAASIMRELGHERLDLVKVSAEGAEYVILETLLDPGLRPGTVCAEFSLPADVDRMAALARRFTAMGYRLVSRSLRHGGWKVTWTSEERAAAPAPNNLDSRRTLVRSQVG
jgi:FkbM family methyltransferase